MRSPRYLFWVALLATVAAGCGSAAPAGNRSSGVPVASTDEATSLHQRFVSVVKAVSPKVVQIQAPVALSSGVGFDAQGDVVTNAHVVDNAPRFVVTLASGDRHPARLVDTDAAMDVAVVRIIGARPRSAIFANSDEVDVGDLTLAIGNPLGLRSSVTEGIVSAVGRNVIPTLAAVDPEMGAEVPGIGFAIATNTVRRTAIRLASSVARHGASR